MPKFISDEEMKKLESTQGSAPKPRFLSDEEMAAIEAPAVEPQVPEVSGGTKARAGLQGFGQASTFGYLPQLQAGTRPVLKKIYEMVTGEKVPDKTYVEARDSNIAKDKMLAEQAPGSYLSGQIAGSLSTPIPAGALFKGAKLAQAAKQASLLSKVGKAAATGAATAAVYNPGDVAGQVSGLQAGDRLKNAGAGALVGSAAQGLLGGTGKLLKAYANKGKAVEEISDAMALDSIGAKKADVKKLLKKEQTGEVAKFIKEEGIASVGGTFDDAYAKAKVIAEDVGSKIGEIYKKAQEQANNVFLKKKLSSDQVKELVDTEFNTTKIYDDIIGAVESEFKSVSKGPQALKQVKQSLSPMKNLGEVAELDQLLKFRRSLDETINFDRAVKDMPQAQKALVKARQLLKERIDKRIDVIDKIVGGESGKSLKALNKRFSLNSTVLDIAEDKMAREQANRMFGLTDTMLMGGGAGAGAISGLVDPNADASEVLKRAALGGSVGLMSRGLRKYGPSASAQVLDSTAKFLDRDPFGRPAGLLAEKLGKLGPARIASTTERTRK